MYIFIFTYLLFIKYVHILVVRPQQYLLPGGVHIEQFKRCTVHADQIARYMGTSAVSRHDSAACISVPSRGGISHF